MSFDFEKFEKVFSEKIGIPIILRFDRRLKYEINAKVRGPKEKGLVIAVNYHLEDPAGYLSSKRFIKWLINSAEPYKKHYNHNLSVITPLSEIQDIVDDYVRIFEIGSGVKVRFVDNIGTLGVMHSRHGSHRMHIHKNMRYLEPEHVETLVAHEMAHGKVFELWMSEQVRLGEIVEYPSQHGDFFWEVYEEYYPGAKRKEDELQDAWENLFDEVAKMS